MAGTVTARCVINKQNVKVCYPPTTITSGVESVVAGTNVTVDDTDPRNPIVSSTGGSGGITGIAPVGNLLRVLTVDGGGNVVTAEASHIYESSTSCQMYIDSPSAYYEVGVLDTITGDVAGFQAQPIFAIMHQQGAIFELVGQEAYLKTISVPLGGAGIIGVDAAGKLFTTTAGGGTTTNPLTIGTGLSGTSFDGSAPVTIEIDSTVATLSGAQALTNKTGLISQWTNDSGYLTSVGTVPASSVSAGTFGTGAYVMDTSLSLPALIGKNGQLSHTTVAQSSGAIIDYLYTPANHTGQTASTNTPVFRVASATKTLATGALTAWYANHFQTQTLAFAGASTTTDAFGLYVENVTEGTNATLTNSYSLGTSGFVKFGSGLRGVIIRNDVSTNNYCGFYNANTTPSSTNYFLKSNGSTTLLNSISSGLLILAYGGTGVLSFSSSTAMTIAEGVTTNAGTTTGWKIGGATSQKIGFWSKTPIVQPTTAITGATLTGGGGTTITATDTFGGYTLQQIAAALINTGILA